MLGFPDPFAVATIGGEQTRTTSVIKKTLNPYWNESFDMHGPLHCDARALLTGFVGELPRRAYSQYKSSTKRSSRRRIKDS